MENECPQCGAPLRDDGFCDKFCLEKPTYPPAWFGYSDDGLKICMGKLSTVPVSKVKLYEFEQKWREVSISEMAIQEEAVKVLASLEAMTSGSHVEVSLQDLTEWFLELMAKVYNFGVLEVEPTLWDIYKESMDPNSYLRIAPGRWLAAGNLGVAGVSLLMGLFAHPLWFGGVALPTLAKQGSKIFNFINVLIKALVVMPEGSLDRIVFEALYKLSHQLQIVNYDAERNRDYERAYGFRPANTQQIADETGCEREEVYRALCGLQERGVVSYVRSEDAWHIKF